MWSNQLVTMLSLLASLTVSSPPTKVTVQPLYDSLGAAPKGAQNDWGYAILVRSPSRTVLFDTGADAARLARNARALGVSLSQVDLVVLSHRHGDHIGGLQAVFRANPRVLVFVPFPLGVRAPSSLRQNHRRVTRVTRARTLAPGILVVPTQARGQPDELSLVVETPRGSVVITGCAHTGVEPILAAAREQGKRPLLGLVGGLHLFRTSAAKIRALVWRMKSRHPRLGVSPGHCTGETAHRVFREVFGSDYQRLGLGAMRSF